MKIKQTRLLALAMCGFLAFSTPMTTIFADNETSVDITITNGAEDSIYLAYRLLNATNSGDKYAYTLNPKYVSVLQDITGKTTQEDIVKYIEDLDTTGIRTFADAMYLALRTANLESDETSSNKTFDDVAQGYYLIAETTKSADPDTYSLVMLDTKGENSIEIATKEDTVTIEKKVQETNDSIASSTIWQDAADYDANDDVPFMLTGSLPNNLSGYSTYYYAMHDTLSKGLEYNDDAKIYMLNGETSVDITSKATIVSNKESDGTTKIDFTFDNIKSIDGLTSSSKIEVVYTAKLTESAVLGVDGNPNEVYLEYSNNPYEDGTGKTVKDKVVVFTFKPIVNKVDKDNKALEGAGFTLYKFNAETNEYEVVEVIEDVTTFTFKSIDSGMYKLEETKVPAGYNKASDIVFTVAATYDTNSEDAQLRTLKVVDASGKDIDSFTIDSQLTKLETNVVNLSGNELPETGGIGTTIFYILGIVLVGGTSVVLITKKRASKSK